MNDKSKKPESQAEPSYEDLVARKAEGQACYEKRVLSGERPKNPDLWKSRYSSSLAFENELDIEIIPSPQSPIAGAHVGVRVRHKELNLTVESTAQTTQHANKLAAIEEMKMKLIKQRFADIEEADLVDGDTFRNSLNETDENES